jgi:hypothetical protein
MSAIREAAGVLEAAERSLRGLMGGAATEGDYEAVLQIAGWAKAIGEILARARPGDPPMEVAVPPAGDVTPESVAANDSANEYPKFFRNGDVLVKIGWSKTQKTEYEHKAPFSVVSDLATAISQASSRKKQFAMDAILPLKSSVDGQEIPSYQTYACLGWIREEGLIIQHGRQGYSLKPKTELTISIQDLFKRLPEQQLSAGKA